MAPSLIEMERPMGEHSRSRALLVVVMALVTIAVRPAWSQVDRSPTESRNRIRREANPPPADTGSALAAIDNLSARFLAAYQRRDAAAIAALHTEDVRFISDGTVDRGRATLERNWRAMLPSLSDLHYTVIERVVSGDLATETLRFTQQYQYRGKTVTDSGYAVSVLRRGRDGRWRYHTHMVSRVPAAR
jgi:uncharacterized protein (TIGR02246 family)